MASYPGLTSGGGLAAAVPRSTPLHQTGGATGNLAGASSLLSGTQGSGTQGIPSLSGHSGVSGLSGLGGLPSNLSATNHTGGSYEMFGPIGAARGASARPAPDNLNLDFLEGDSVDMAELLAHLNI